MKPITPHVEYYTIDEIRDKHIKKYPQIGREQIYPMCWCCGEVFKEEGVFVFSILRDDYENKIVLCKKCLYAIHSATSPLVVLATTGKSIEP